MHAVIAQLAGELGFLLDGQDVAAKDQDAFTRLDGAHREQPIAVRTCRARLDVRMEPVKWVVVVGHRFVIHLVLQDWLTVNFFRKSQGWYFCFD